MAHNIKGNYEGYIWKSNATSPDIFNPAKPIDITLDENDNPFVIEGELYDSVKGESISIRFVDGKYIVKTFTVKPEDLKGNDHVTRKEYLAQRMNGVGKLVYLQYWDTITDPLCENMDTLQPVAFVFVGFKSEEK